MRRNLVVLGLMALLACPAASAGHRGADPLDEAFAPALVRLAPGGQADVTLVLANGEPRDVEAALRPALGMGAGPRVEILSDWRVVVPGFGVARVPARVSVPPDATEGAHEARVDVEVAGWSGVATLRVLVGDGGGDLPAPLLDAASLPPLAARVGTTTRALVNVTNGADLSRAFDLDAAGFDGWRFETEGPIVVPAGATRAFPLAFEPTAEAPDSARATLRILEAGAQVAAADVELRLSSRVPPLRLSMPEDVLVVPLNGSAQAILTLHNPADVPQAARLVMGWPFAHGWENDLDGREVALAPRETVNLTFTVRDAHGLPHETASALAAVMEDGTSVAVPLRLVGEPALPWGPRHDDLVAAGSMPAAPGAPGVGADVGAGAGAGVAAGVGVAALGVALAHRRWPLAFAALYARVSPARVLDQPRRRALVDLVRAHPGIPMAEAQRRLGLSNGQVAHHVRRLVRARVLLVTRDGPLRRLTLAEHGPAPRENVAERALAHLEAHGASSVRDLADALGVSRQLAHHHLRRLLAEGRIAARLRRGRLVVAAAGEGSSEDARRA